MTAVAVRCDCGAEIDVEILYISSRYDWRRGWKPQRLIAVAPASCPQAHVLDDAARKQLETAAIAQRECSSCFESITESQPSFAVRHGRVHETCRRSYAADMAEQECGDDPMPEAHYTADWPPDSYRGWIR